MELLPQVACGSEGVEQGEIEAGAKGRLNETTHCKRCAQQCRFAAQYGLAMSNRYMDT